MANLPSAFVVWDGEPIRPVNLTHDAKRLILNVVARRRVGWDSADVKYPDTDTKITTWTGQRVLTVSVRAENFGQEEGFDLLEDLRSQLEDERKEDLSSMALSLNDTQEIYNLDAAVNQRAISVAQMDIVFNQTVTRTRTETGGGFYIESAELEGEGELSGVDVTMEYTE